MNKMITDLVEQCANVYNLCKEYMNDESLSLIERNHRSKIMQECVYREANFRPYIKIYEEKTWTRRK